MPEEGGCSEPLSAHAHFCCSPKCYNLLLRSANLLFWLAYLQIISVKNFRSLSIIRPAVHLSQNTRKWSWNAKKRKVYSGVFRAIFSAFCAPFFAFCISQHFAPGLAFARKLEGFCGLFFWGINITRNSHEMREVYSVSYFIVFCEKNSWHAKCEKCIAGLTGTLRLLMERRRCVIVLKGENNLVKSCGNLKGNNNNLIKIS